MSGPNVLNTWAQHRIRKRKRREGKEGAGKGGGGGKVVPRLRWCAFVTATSPIRVPHGLSQILYASTSMGEKKGKEKRKGGGKERKGGEGGGEDSFMHIPILAIAVNLGEEKILPSAVRFPVTVSLFKKTFFLV